MICFSRRCKVRTYNALNEKSVVDTMELPEILQILAPPPVQVKQELLSLFSPEAPSGKRSNWIRLEAVGHAAPVTAVIWKVMLDADFRCAKCSSQYRITLDHIDDDATNHDESNLQCLCTPCNTEKANGVKNPGGQVVIFEEFFQYIEDNGTCPTQVQLNKQIASKYPCENPPLSGYTDLYYHLKHRHQNPIPYDENNVFESMRGIVEIGKVLKIHPDEMKRGVISKFTMGSLSSKSSSWKGDTVYAHDAPTPEVFREVLQEGNYQCKTCGSWTMLTIDHIDNNQKNHEKDNLQILCKGCNKKKSERGMAVSNQKALIFDIMWTHFKDSNGEILTPPKIGRIIKDIHPEYTQEKKSLGGQIYFHKFLSRRLEGV